ncbi:hypothetical protein WR25_03124 [Diploscapter pachys]|uniref:BPTI/Kunitz inhibitor domain-containing protein n=1 Tax=Diploscapter pachys TaxID=2018661 RepID=A0A2A2JIZ7_9BILA|nr:hypothetical protein WR25_03124 [Diploscapter pachys]
MKREPWLIAQILACLLGSARCALECDPTSNTKKPDPSNPESYLYCNLEGTFSKRKCIAGKIFNATSGDCEPIGGLNDALSILSQPFYQAPDDLCGAGIPLTILSAPVVCNPSISSCPDGYVCRMYERTGTSYCCQNSSPIIDEREYSECPEGEITLMEEISNRPRSCVMSQKGSCPAGFECTLLGGTTTRCCGKSFGCPYNSAALLHPASESFVECSPSAPKPCQAGFSCVRSNTLSRHICCSATEENPTKKHTCPNGESPLSSPSECSSANSESCPPGYVCRNSKCCSSAGLCPAGNPLGGGTMACSAKNPCASGYECVTTGGLQYCCPNREFVCNQSKHAGTSCASPQISVTRYYFDKMTGSCKPFQFSQCGGNSNNFGSLEECEGFCVDTQCETGQAYRVGAINAACSISAPNTCPRDYSCSQPLFGQNNICCPSQELICSEMVSAGTPCFGKATTVQRFYYNAVAKKCQPFQYYGCNGNSNNFDTVDDCKNTCQNLETDKVCDGAAPLMDPNQLPQRCSEEVPCPAGYNCNSANYCCPFAEIACSASLSRGNKCSGVPPKTMWFYDPGQKKCEPFTYNGCAGTANRFISQTACMKMCSETNKLGNCPKGMSAYMEDGETSPKTCTLNVIGTCPQPSSCVRSTTNQAICCETTVACPDGRRPYYIPGSSSVVACNPDGDNCPGNNVCVESSTVQGFHMCCSETQSVSSRPQKNRKSRPDTLAELIDTISPCPPRLTTNGQTCHENVADECPSNYICYKEQGYEKGRCCKTKEIPKCTQYGYLPVFLEDTQQVQTCSVLTDDCPKNSLCMTSSLAKVAICCQEYKSTVAKNRKNEWEVVGSDEDEEQPPQSARPRTFGSHVKQQQCKGGNAPYHKPNGQVLKCSFDLDNCPKGFKCEFSSTGEPVCCGEEKVTCPVGTIAFAYGERPLACPAGSTKCPIGFACLPSSNPKHHLCCSTSPKAANEPQCLRGVAYVNPATSDRQYCSPQNDACPIGHKCFESTVSTKFICCSIYGELNVPFSSLSVNSNLMSGNYKGYCPPRQMPYVHPEGFVSTCHMQLNPCPATAPYVCIYSPEKLNSYCCAPMDFATNTWPMDGFAASPMRKLGTPDSEIGMSGSEQPSPLAGSSVVIPGIPDPIPGVQIQNILPPSLLDKVIKMNIPLPGVNNANNNNMNNANPMNMPKIMALPMTSTASGCPAGSRPLVRLNSGIAECAEQPCPEGFSCVFTEVERRFQCCSNAFSFSSMKKTTAKPDEVDEAPVASKAKLECPPDFFLLDGKCLKILFAGQKGCIDDEQCRVKEKNSTCDKGYCICPIDKPLVHGGKCYDPTTVIFMDSVDERANGTIGGYCLETLIEEERCNVENSYCSEKTVTCQCKVGYDLKMDFDNKTDTGSCILNSQSKYAAAQNEPFHSPVMDDELYFIDAAATQTTESSSNNSTEIEESSGDELKYLLQTDALAPEQ